MFMDSIAWLVSNFFQSFLNLAYAVTNLELWLDWSDKKAIMRFVYYGGSIEFFFVVFTTFILLFFAGALYRPFMWRMVVFFEGIANTIGRAFAWAGLIMVIQQVLIVIMQRIFTRPDIVLGLGIPINFDISWYAEELKLYNALVITLCATYTFVQGGHVRVGLPARQSMPTTRRRSGAGPRDCIGRGPCPRGTGPRVRRGCMCQPLL